MKLVFSGDLRIDDLVSYHFNGEEIIEVIDFEHVGFIYPSALVPLAAYLFEKKNHEPRIINPESENIFGYLKRMNFDKISGIKLSIQQRRNPPEGRFVELSLIKSKEDMDKFMKNLKEVFENEIDLNTLSNILQATSELIENVLIHAGESSWCVAMAQKYRTNIEVAISDRGIGIRGSLSQNKDYHVPFDSIAVQLAIKKGVTRDKNRFSGNGLWRVKTFATKMGGNFWLWSGYGFYISYPWAETAGKVKGYWKGTSTGFFFKRA